MRKNNHQRGSFLLVRLGLSVMLGKRELNLFEGEEVMDKWNPREDNDVESSAVADEEEEEEVYLRKSLSNSSSSREGNAVSVVEEALGVVGVDLEAAPPVARREEDDEEHPEEEDGVLRWWRGDAEAEEEEVEDEYDAEDAARGEGIATLS